MPEDNNKKEFKGSWERPVKVDKESMDPLTLARMTDHNVRGMNGQKGVESELADQPVPSPSAEPVQNAPRSRKKAA